MTPVLSWASTNPVVDIQTNRGLISVQLAADKAPITVDNFLRYVDEGFYENTVFHRVINDFMIQGGGYNADLEVQEVHDPITLETNVGLSNARGTIAMARRAGADTASSQFFINTQDNLTLDYQNFSKPGYAVFGEVIEGMDIVDAISELKTNNVSAAVATEGEPLVLRNVPEEPVLIEAMRLREGQLSFVDMQATYTTGDIITVSLEETMIRQKALDLWVAILMDDGRLLYVTEQGFSEIPGVFMPNVSVADTSHPVFELTVPQGLIGHFTLLAIFNTLGAGIEDLDHSLRSNIAAISVDLI
ncbi:MAG: hypothetical protein GQ583_00665 [Methyloprofundus sp.]|nr:hypothetical protein [Methyloprofundus sp.]